MNKISVFLILILSSIIWPGKIYSQIEFDINESFFTELSTDTIINNNKINFEYIGGFSAVDQSNEKNHYFIISDAHKGTRQKGDAQYYDIKIIIDNGLSIEFTGKNKIPKPEIWPESFRISSDGKIFITEERTIKLNDYSFLYHISENSEINEILLPEKYRKKMHSNSGFEGMCFSDDESKLYLALERPLPVSSDRNFTNILELNLININSEINEYLYPFQRNETGNGVSEILNLNDSILIVMERDFVFPKNYVSLYSVNLSDYEQQSESGFSKILKPKQIFTFDDVNMINGKDFQVNNLEGICFSSDRKYLIMISDNNFGNKCKCTPTQIIALKIKNIL